MCYMTYNKDLDRTQMIFLETVIVLFFNSLKKVGVGLIIISSSEGFLYV